MLGKVSIRHANRNDVEIIRNIDSQCFNVPYGTSLWNQKISNDKIYVATLDLYDNVIVGFLIITLNSKYKGVALVDKIAVLPQYRKNGISDKFTKLIVSKYSLILANVRSHNTASINLWLKHGFLVVLLIPNHYMNGDTCMRILKTDNKKTSKYLSLTIDKNTKLKSKLKDILSLSIDLIKLNTSKIGCSILSSDITVDVTDAITIDIDVPKTLPTKDFSATVKINLDLLDLNETLLLKVKLFRDIMLTCILELIISVAGDKIGDRIELLLGSNTGYDFDNYLQIYSHKETILKLLYTQLLKNNKTKFTLEYDDDVIYEGGK